MESDKKLNLEGNSSLNCELNKDGKQKNQSICMNDNETQSVSKINTLLKNYQEFKRRALGNKRPNSLCDSAHGEFELSSLSKELLNKVIDEAILTSSNISSKPNLQTQNQTNHQKKQNNQVQSTDFKNINQETTGESKGDTNLLSASVEAVVKSQPSTSSTLALLNSFISQSKHNLIADDKFITLLIKYESILSEQQRLQHEIKKLDLDLEENKKLVIQYLDAYESVKLRRNAQDIQLNELENEKISIQKEIYHNVFKNHSFSVSSDQRKKSFSIMPNLELTDYPQNSKALSNNKSTKSSSSRSSKILKYQTNKSSEPKMSKCSKEEAVTEDKKRQEEKLSSFEKCRSKVIDLVRKRKSSTSQDPKDGKKIKTVSTDKSDENKASIDLSKIDKINKMLHEISSNFLTTLDKPSEVSSSISAERSKCSNNSIKSATTSTRSQDTCKSSTQKCKGNVILLDTPENSNCSQNDSFIIIPLENVSDCVRISLPRNQSSTTAATTNTSSSVTAFSTEPSLPKKPTSFELLESVANKPREAGYIKTSNESMKIESSLEFNNRDVYTSTSKFVSFQIFSNYIYVNFRNSTLTRYNRHNVQDLTKYLGLSSSVRCFCPLISLNRLYSGSDDKLLRCHDLKTGLLLNSLNFSSAIVSMDIRLGFLTIGLSSGMIHQLELISQALVTSFQASDTSIHEIKITGSEIQEAKILIITFRQMLVRKLSDGSLFYSIPFEGFIHHSFYPNNHFIFYANKCGIKIFDYMKRKEVSYTKTINYISTLTKHQDIIYIGTRSGQVHAYCCQNPYNLKLLWIYLLKHTNPVQQICIENDLIFTSIFGKNIIQIKPEKGWPFVCKCSQCYYPFALHDHLKCHISNHHKRGSSKLVNICPWQGCSQKISNDLLTHHLVKYHVEKEPSNSV